MVRGKRPCELGRDCPYKHEYQHNLEFSHPDNSAGASAAAGAKTKRFEGTARKLGGSISSSRPRPVSNQPGGSSRPRPVPNNQPERKKPRPAARRAAADAALRRAADGQTEAIPNSASLASSSNGPLRPLSATARNKTAAAPQHRDAARLPMQGNSQRTSASSAVAAQPKKKAPITREASSDVIDLTGFD